MKNMELITLLIIVFIGAKLIDLALGNDDSDMTIKEKAYWWGRLLGQIILPALTALVVLITLVTVLV